MSYTTSEAAAQAVLAGVTGFSTATVVLGDFGQLSRGPAQLMVLSYAGFEQEINAGAGDVFITWNILLHLYVKYVDDVTVHARAAVLRQAIIDRLNAYYRLNGAANVNHAEVMSGSVPGTGEPPGALANVVIGNVKYYKETFRVSIVEESDFAFVA